MNDFYVARANFRNYVSGYYNESTPLSYDEWMNIPDSHKAAVLFVQFFDQVIKAWYRLQTPAANEAECTSEVMLYLNKNVSKIMEDPKRFKPAYIYKICYNCIYCKSVDFVKMETSWYNNTVSNIVQTDDDTVDLFDTVAAESGDDLFETLRNESYVSAFWNTVESLDTESASVLAELLGETVPKKQRVSEERKAVIVKELRSKFYRFL